MKPEELIQQEGLLDLYSFQFQKVKLSLFAIKMATDYGIKEKQHTEDNL